MKSSRFAVLKFGTVFFLSWSSQRPSSLQACALVLLYKRGEKHPFNFSQCFFRPVSYAFYTGKLFAGFYSCFHASALVYLKFDGENQFISLRPSHYWWMVIKMEASVWDYTAETTLYFGLV